MRMLKLLCQWPIVAHKKPLLYSDGFCVIKCGGYKMGFSTRSDESDLKDFAVYMDSLKNYEKLGVPRRAGTDSEDGFDLGRMRRLMELLGNPQSKFKAVHIAGTKGKGSTAAFISNILRAEGYSVGSYTSPHVQTIRERMSIGRLGEPVSAKALNSFFLSIKEIIDQAMELEDECISHFEVLTAMAFALFAKQNVDIAIIEAGLGGARDATNIISSSELATSIITTIGEEHLDALGGSLESIAVAKSGIIKHGCPLVLGGPFLPHIERILLDKASSMSSPVVSASDARNRSEVKGISMVDEIPCQCCDIVMHVEWEPNLSIELFDVKLRMLGRHMVQNAATATCAALCLRNLGWKLSDSSIRAGLENTYLLGRSQVLSPSEAEALGLPKTTIMLDGAHTKESAKALAETIKMSFPKARLALVVAMASDKDHLGFAKEFFSGVPLDAVCFTEAVIAGSKTRTTPASVLRDCWVQVSKELGMPILHDGMAGHQKLNKGQLDCSESIMDNRTIFVAEESFLTSIKIANEILLRGKQQSESGLIVVTGSLHVVSLALAAHKG